MVITAIVTVVSSGAHVEKMSTTATKVSYFLGLLLCIVHACFSQMGF